MATTDKKQKPNQEVKVPEAQKAYEATYTIEELVDASATFKTNRTVVRAALSQAGKEAYTMKEATQIIEKMKTKEVRA